MRASGAAHAMGASQAGMKSWPTMAIYSQLVVSPRTAAGTHRPAASASSTVAAESATSRHRISRRPLREATIAAAQAMARTGPARRHGSAA